MWLCGLLSRACFWGGTSVSLRPLLATWPHKMDAEAIISWSSLTKLATGIMCKALNTDSREKLVTLEPSKYFIAKMKTHIVHFFFYLLFTEHTWRVMLDFFFSFYCSWLYISRSIKMSPLSVKSQIIAISHSFHVFSILCIKGYEMLWPNIHCYLSYREFQLHGSHINNQEFPSFSINHMSAGINLPLPLLLGNRLRKCIIILGTSHVLGILLGMVSILLSAFIIRMFQPELNCILMILDYPFL